MIRWLLDNPQIALAVAGAIAYWLQQRKEAGKKKDTSAGRAPMTHTREEGDSDATRRIQEEIRRKIAQRREGTVPPPIPHAPPARVETPQPTQWTAPRPVAREISERMRQLWDAKLSEARAREEHAGRERVRRQAEETEALEAERIQEAQHAREVSLQQAAVEAATADEVHHREVMDTFVGGLRGRVNLRRAMVLREVLGPPVALRSDLGERT